MITTGAKPTVKPLNTGKNNARRGNLALPTIALDPTVSITAIQAKFIHKLLTWKRTQDKPQPAITGQPFSLQR